MNLCKSINHNLENRPVLKYFFILLVVFFFCQYAYSIFKLPFKNSFFVDFGHFYYYSKVLEGFEAKKNTATEKDIFYALIGESVNHPYESEAVYARQEIPHAWGNAPHHPAFYLLVRPLTKLPYKLATGLWLLLNQIFLVGGIILCIKTVKKGIFLWELAAISFIIASFSPLKMSNLLGQTGVSVFFLLSFGLYNFSRKRDILTGIALGLAVIIRWFPALFILYFIFKRRWKAAVAGIFVVGLGFAVSIWRFGLLLHIVQFKYMPKFYFDYAVGLVENVSLSGFFYRLLVRTVQVKLPYPTNLGDWNFAHTNGVADNIPLANFLTAFFIMLFFAVSFLACRKKIEPRGWRLVLEFSLFTALLPIFSTCITTTFMPVLLLVFLCLFFYFVQVGSPPTDWAFFISSFTLVALEYWLDGIKFFWHGWWTIFLSGKLYGAILLWLLCLKLLRAQDKNEISLVIDSPRAECGENSQ